MPEPALVERHAHYAVVTLNRPEKRNPLPYRDEDGVRPALEALAREDAIRAVVLAGSGKAFCSGLDLSGLKELQATSAAQNLADSEAVCAFFEYLRAYPKPLIAAVNGPAVAGGAGLALLCDVALGSEHARFSFSEVRIGFVPAMVGVYLTRAVGERVAREILLSARWVNAEEAKILHLLHELVDAEALMSRAAERAMQFAELSPEALRRAKGMLARGAEQPLPEALRDAVKGNAEARDTDDCKEGIRSFLEKRKPRWAP
ncbi:MAG: enoyl-CoA hydratase-related protein [Planctomycetota bacterium]|nr:enoyl-CoA hydratase-related protein [Planctomycetota bacterium]